MRERKLRSGTMLRMIRRDDGAVTIFSVVVLSALLLFVSVLIDYARIAALHKMAEDAARAGARSVLSAYDSMLYERYGLFGRGGTEGNSIYMKVAQANLEQERSLSGNSLRMVNAQMRSAHVNNAEVLGSHSVFVRQVLEEMKYKAPVDFTLELAAKFTPLSLTMKEASVTVDLLESLRKLYDKREAKLIAVLELQQQAANSLGSSGIPSLLPAKSIELAASGSTAIHLAGEYKQYAQWVLHDQSTAGQSPPKYKKEREAYEREARDLINELTKKSGAVLDDHEKLQGKAIQELMAAKQLNEDMKRIAEEARTGSGSVDNSYDRVAGSTVAGSEEYRMAGGNPVNELQEIWELSDELVLPDSWFTEYEEELANQSSSYASFHMEAGGFSSNMTASLSAPQFFNETLMEGVVNMRMAYEQYEQAYSSPDSVLKQRERSLTDNEIRKQRQAQEAKADSLWKQARGILHGLTALPQSEEHLSVVRQVEERYNNNLLFNQTTQSAVESSGQDETPSDAYGEAEAASTLMGGLFGGLADMLEQARDSVYMGEYVLQRYSVFAPQNLRAMVQNGDTSELTHSLAFNNQEAEYIIYGFHSSTANLAAAYGELIGIRMAIRTMEGLAACRASGHPLLILSCSVVYGLEKTIEDMLAFTERGAAPLSKYVEVDVSYTDYLRLFMLIHGGSDNPASLARMIAVIELNGGVTLSKIPTAVTGEIQAAADLWFLPGVIQLIGHFGLLQGKVVDGRYETTQTMGWSY